jgi:purine-nucleoside phosphorylase
MSTALEAIAARALGVEVVALSLVTNFAAGVTGQELNHAEVLAQGAESGPRIAKLLAQIVALMLEDDR